MKERERRRGRHLVGLCDAIAAALESGDGGGRVRGKGGETEMEEKPKRRRRAVKSAEAFRRRAKGLAMDALDRLGEIATDPQSAAQHAIPAGKAIIEYAYGKPGVEKEDGLSEGLERLDALIGALDKAAQEE